MAARPGVCIFVASICFDLLSSGLRQATGVKG
jgi:ABC-type dipeptide/oligopeptide/nickel transport system permease subunit